MRFFLWFWLSYCDSFPTNFVPVNASPTLFYAAVIPPILVVLVSVPVMLVRLDLVEAFLGFQYPSHFGTKRH